MGPRILFKGASSTFVAHDEEQTAAIRWDAARGRNPRPAAGQTHPFQQRQKHAGLGRARVQRARDVPAQLFDEDRGNRAPQVHGTLWAAYNGVAECVDYALTRVEAWRN